jgi:hypothetical protein
MAPVARRHEHIDLVYNIQRFIGKSKTILHKARRDHDETFGRGDSSVRGDFAHPPVLR